MMRTIVITAICAAITLGSAESAFAQKKPANADSPGVFGIVKKVDEKSITLAVATTKGQPAQDQNFSLAADVKISVFGKEAKSSEIVIDKPAALKLNADKKVIAIVQDKQGEKGNKGAAGVAGTLKKVDEKANSIVIAIVTQKGQPAEDQTFTLSADVKVSVLGNAGKLSDLKTDKQVQLKLDADKKVLAVLQADKVAADGISGLVKKVDEKSNAITLAISGKKGQPVQEQTFSVAADAKILVFGKPAKLSEIDLEKPAMLTFGADKKVTAIAQGKGEKKPQ